MGLTKTAHGCGVMLNANQRVTSLVFEADLDNVVKISAHDQRSLS